MEEENSLVSYFQDYPSIVRGLGKLKATVATDFQQQLFSLDAALDSLIITAPADSGKTLALLLHALRRFINEEAGLLVVLAHSKDQAQQLHRLSALLTQLPAVNLFMGALPEDSPKCVLIGSPLQVNNLWKKDKDRIGCILVPEADLLFGFGYGEALALLAGSLPAERVAWRLSCAARSEEIEKFKTEWMRRVSRVDYSPPEGEQKVAEPREEQVTHFYCVGDKLTLPICLYVTLKFGLVNPKILVLVDNLREVYRCALFLERCRVAGVGVYNHENPTDLKFYGLSVWMNGATGILLATPQLLLDLRGNLFKTQAKKAYKRSHFELSNMTSIITLGLGQVEGDWGLLFEQFQLKPMLMTFLESGEREIERLQGLIEWERGKFEHVVARELPITRKELEGFRYRVNDVWSSLNNHRADLYQQLDFKKKLLKTPELKQEFEGSGREREVLVKAINELRKKIDHGKVNISDFVPEYLVPECLRAAYAEKMKVLQAKLEEEAPISHQKVKRVLRHVDLEDENPETTDISRLKLISARKRWKLLHGFKLKKRNRRMEQKGVFETG